jgi:maleate isomerase
MFGWRGCYGWVSPSTIQLPWELEAMLPEGVGVVATNLNVRTHEAAEFERAQQGIEAAIDVVVGEGAQAVVLAGVPLAVRQGYRREQEAHAASATRAGVPVTSGSAAAVMGLQALGARRPVIVTAYLEEFNRLIVGYLEDAGLAVAGVAGLSVRSPAEASQVEPSAYYRLAKELLLEHPEADSVFLGTRGNVMSVVLQLEEDFGLPVVHSPQAGLWWALRHLRIAPRPGWGRLLSQR